MHPAASSLELEVEKGLPFSAFTYIDVTFETANLDVQVDHTLRPITPEDINYQVVRADRACLIYHDQSATRRPWGRGYILLRSDTAGAKVRLLLSVER
jgi:hypothetical protein